MNQSYTRIAKNTMFLYFRMLIIMAVSFYTIRIVLDTLGVSDFGIYNLVASFVMILAFLNNTLTGGTQRFLTFEIGKNDFKKLKQTFSTALIIHLALAFLMFLFAETIGLWFLYEKMNIPADRFDAAFWTYQLAIISSMVMVMQVPYNALIIAHEKMHIFAYISIAEAILKLLIVYLLLIVSSDKLISYAFFMCLASLIIAFTYRSYAIRNYKESHFEFLFDRNIVKSMVHFSGWNIFGTLGSILSVQGINIVLNIFFGPIAVAARSLSNQVGGGLNQFSGAFQQAVTPQITKLFASNQIDELNRLLYQNAKYAFLLLWFLALPVLLEMNYILSIWLVEIPENTALFCQLMIIHGLISSLNRPYVMAIHATGNMRQTNVTAGVLLLLVIPVSYILLDNGFSIITPFIVYIIATVLCFFIELYYLRIWIQVCVKSIFIKTVIPIILIVTLTAIPPYWLQNYFEESFVRFVIVGLASCACIILFTYLVALNKVEKEQLKMMMKNRIQKRKV